MYTQAHTQRPVGFWACYFQQHILGAHICEIISQIPTDTECTLTRPIHPSPSLPPQLPSLSLIFTMVLSSPFFSLLVSISEREHSILVFLCLPYFPQHAVFCIHVTAQMTGLHFFSSWLSITPLCVYHIFYSILANQLSIHLLVGIYAQV